MTEHRGAISARAVTLLAAAAVVGGGVGGGIVAGLSGFARPHVVAAQGGPEASAPTAGGPAEPGSQTPDRAGAVAPEDIAVVARQLNCPLCQGYNLQDCPLVVCAQMRELIGEQLVAGATEEEIIASFVEQYGPSVLNEPPKEGVHLAAWLVPLGVLAVGAALGLVWFRSAGGRAGNGAPEVPGAPAADAADYEARFAALAGPAPARDEAPPRKPQPRGPGTAPSDDVAEPAEQPEDEER